MFDGFVVMSGGHCTHPTGGPAIRLKHKKRKGFSGPMKQTWPEANQLAIIIIISAGTKYSALTSGPHATFCIILSFTILLISIIILE